MRKAVAVIQRLENTRGKLEGPFLEFNFIFLQNMTREEVL